MSAIAANMSAADAFIVRPVAVVKAPPTKRAVSSRSRSADAARPESELHSGAACMPPGK